MVQGLINYWGCITLGVAYPLDDLEPLYCSVLAFVMLCNQDLLIYFIIFLVILFRLGFFIIVYLMIADLGQLGISVYC